ncbi:MAG: lasso peptide biosynthesis B2 protein [Candidatus Marinimicrobia bacterium]|nr:lasso peptide biosynthesis B2 protein [Candidatus Neomarinimicrobiota bacterium]
MSKKILLVLEALLLLTFLRLSLSFFGIHSLLKQLKNPKFTFVGNRSLSRNIRAVELASLVIPKCTCLLEAAALKIISPVNSEMTLIIGVSNNPVFQSHAWIEIDNQIIFGESSTQEQYKPILRVN